MQAEPIHPPELSFKPQVCHMLPILGIALDTGSTLRIRAMFGALRA